MAVAAAADDNSNTVRLQHLLCRSSISGVHLASGGSLELATDTALAQLGTFSEGPNPESSPSTPCRRSLSADHDQATKLKDDGARSQNKGSITSPFAQLASHVISPAGSHAALSAEPAADMTRDLSGRAISRCPDDVTEDCDIWADSASRMAAAIQEAEACRTMSDDGGDKNHATKSHMCSSHLLRTEDHHMQSSPSRALDFSKHRGTEQRPTDGSSLGSAPTGMEPEAVIAYQGPIAFMLSGNGGSNYSEVRAQRRRTRQVTVLPDQENLRAIEAAILEHPHSAVQKPLKSRTNLLGRRAASLHAACDPCHDDGLLSAALHEVPSCTQAGQRVLTREDVYKPLSAQPTRISLTGSSSGSRSPQAPDGAAWGTVSTGAAGCRPQHDIKPHQGVSRSSIMHAQKCWWAAPVPTYMRSTVSMRAKAEVATQQTRACKAVQQDKRRWSY